MFREREYNLTESNSKAERECRMALSKAGYAFAPVPASFHWSQLVNPAGDKMAAAEAYEQLLQLEPENKAALEGLAYLYQIIGLQDAAHDMRKKLYNVEAIELGVNSVDLPQVVNYLLAQNGLAPQPSRVPASYMKLHFDKYANNFDMHLTEKLLYKGPQLIRELLEKDAFKPQVKKVLDLGCGTGLVGEQLMQLADTIDGIDISDGMLKKAKQRAVYQNLISSDILDALHDNDTDYTLIVAADVLIYQGNLEQIFALVKSALQADGLFVFTIETSDSDKVLLRNSGRFQHSPGYVNQLAKQYGFRNECEQEVILRVEDDKPVRSSIFVLRA